MANVRHVSYGLLGATILSLGGCGAEIKPHISTTVIEHDTVISRTSALSNVYVQKKNSNYVTCVEPPPDAAYNQIEDTDLSFSLVNLGGNEKEGQAEGSEETPLVGRTPGVLLTRELFFRACEVSRNLRLDKSEALAIYRETMKTVQEGWAIEVKNTTVKIDESETYNVTQVIPGVADGSHNGGASFRPAAAPVTIVRPATTSMSRTITSRSSTTGSTSSRSTATGSTASTSKTVGSASPSASPSPTTSTTKKTPSSNSTSNSVWGSGS